MGRAIHQLTLTQLETVVQDIYKCSLIEFFLREYNRGLLDGYRLGKIDGRRAAKGRKKTRAQLGRPASVDRSLCGLMIYQVDKAKLSGSTVEQAIDVFLKTLQLGAQERGERRNLPTLPQATRAYYKRTQSHQSRDATLRDLLDLLKRIEELVGPHDYS
jgi:hypothetical protein